ncbi:MAG TPA: hypothetical protein VFN10_14890 [Thermoanaerobaculia bacterium]|nr:hypothetical protein [Thermoanaerobaculia bacterium]
MKRLVLVILVVAVVSAAVPLLACEECRGPRPMCWSGVAIGYQSCYGGFGTPCTLDGSCVDCAQIGCLTAATAEEACDNPIAGCVVQGIDAPPAGFVLEKTEKPPAAPPPAFSIR